MARLKPCPFGSVVGIGNARGKPHSSLCHLTEQGTLVGDPGCRDEWGEGHLVLLPVSGELPGVDTGFDCDARVCADGSNLQAVIVDDEIQMACDS
jgi:hypothetical protein